jgi:hypothetical protein
MKIESAPHALSIHIEHYNVQKLLYNAEGNLTVIGKDDEHLIQFQTKASIAYNQQYGTPISPDGRFVFIGTWEQGLFCYGLENGKLVWKQSPGKVGRIIVHENLLIVEMVDRGIYVRDISTGQLLNEVKMSSMDCFVLVNEKEVFAGPKNGKYFLLDIPSLKINKTISAKDLNINNSLSFIILDVFYKDKDLIIKGWEQYTNGNAADARQTPFERMIH